MDIKGLDSDKDGSQLSDEEVERELDLQKLQDESKQLTDEEEERISDNLELRLRSEKFEENDNNLHMLELWSSYRTCNYTIPNDLQEKIDAYLLAQLKNERSRYVKSDLEEKIEKFTKSQLKSKIKEEIEKAVNKAQGKGLNGSAERSRVIATIAEREGVTTRTIRKWIECK